ncbi:hypothetical protein [Armatimonas sp.]|uniref:DUF1963 domain-containing protein n=1 Tax=Armatimonas sp. TaxID=1872638 RepID=UPI00286A38A4|nr:hypothetical protein [Armatimonas sp.]
MPNQRRKVAVHLMNELLAILSEPRRRSGSLVESLMQTIKAEEWEPLIRAAIVALTIHVNEPAHRIIEQANEQHPEILSRYLKELFLTNHYFLPSGYAGSRRMFYPWRDAGAEQIQFLKNHLENDERREFAIRALLELRLPEAFELIPLDTDPTFIHLVGFSREICSFRQLYSEKPYHLQFAKTYATNSHETWQEVTERPYRFGGQVEGQHCPTCGDTLHHLLTFPAAELLSDTCTLPSLTLATCNHCLGWYEPFLCLRHNEQGIPQSSAPVKPFSPEFICAPLLETQVALTPVSDRYRWQEWVYGPNLHRLGGHPAWVQLPEYPDCPECQRTMMFLLQLDSELPLIHHNPDDWSGMFWGSGGVAYFFWCDSCRISAGRWQCT